MSRNSRARIAALHAVAGALLLAFVSCATPGFDTPSGFALYQDRDRPLAVSPEGVRFAVRAVANDPRQDLEFWTAALERHMESSGYRVLASGRFDSHAGAGSYAEWLAPVGDEDWVYLSGVVVAGDSILIAEAAGSFELYHAYRADILEALRSLRLDR